MKKIKVILADDHILLRSGLKLLLQNDASIEVVGEASNGIEALKLLESVEADIIVLDISMPGMDGIECIKEIRSRGLSTKIIVLTMYNDEDYIKEVMRSGAMAFVQKASVDTELFSAIKSVYQGEIYLSRKDSQLLLSMLLSDQKQEHKEDDPYNILSPREREVLKLIVHGYSIKEIGEWLSLSVKTVETYKTRIMEKLNFSKKSEMVSYAIRYGLLSNS